MSHPIYSTRFICLQGVTGNSGTVTVPVGKVYIVKQLTFYSNPLLAPARGFFVDEQSGAALFGAATNAGTPAWFGFYGQLVFEAGQGFHWHAEVSIGDAIDVGAFGYVLSAT